LRQKNYPLVTALKRNLKKIRYRFHLPARLPESNHSSLKEWQELYRYELTELPGLDDLAEPTGAINNAQKLAARYFGAEHTFFLVNGSTAGIIASIMATCGEGEKILLPRNIHRSVVAALIFSGAEPIFVPVENHHELELPLNLLPHRLNINEHYRLALITSPSYEGVVPDLKEISTILSQRHETLFLVDEAHGAHFNFHPSFPHGAAKSSADIWVNSAHKTLGALTPGAFLHVAGNRVDPERLQFVLSLIQTSSPSYPVMASLDLVREIPKNEWERLVSLSEDAKDRINRETVFHCLKAEDLPSSFSLDPLRLTIFLDRISLDGYQLGKILREEHGIEVEMTGNQYLLAMLQPGLNREAINAFIEALRLIQLKYNIITSKQVFWQGNHEQSIPPLIMRPKAAASSCWKEIAWEDAKGEISAKTVSIFPPGVPILIPGEMITDEIIETIRKNVHREIKINGLKNSKTLKVINT